MLSFPFRNKNHCTEKNRVIDEYIHCFALLLHSDDVEPPSRPRTSSGISLGASSGYQSEEEPDELSKSWIFGVS